MKKLAKILLLGLLTVGMTTGCSLEDILKNIDSGSNNSESTSDSGDADSSGNNNYDGDKGSSDSSENSSDSSSSSSSSGTQTGTTWSDDYAAIMSAHLYGTVLPYTGDADTVVAYDEDYDMVTLIGGNVTLTNYESLLIADNYELVGEDEETGAFAAEKAVSTADGDRFVYVYAEYDYETGDFSAQAFDPYYYSFPSEAIEEFFDNWEATPFSIPTIDVENAHFAFQEDEFNIWYYILDMEDSVNASLIAYNCNQSDFAAYYSKLETACWDIESKTSEGETYYACLLNIENVGVARMELYYSADYNAIALTIYAYMSAPDIIPGTTYTSWPATQIAIMLGGDIEDTVPAYTGANNGFQLLDDYYGMAVVVLVEEGTESAGASAYLKTLTDADYVLNGTTKIGDDRYVSPNEEIYVSVFPAATPGTITIYFEAAEEDDSVWPTTKLANALGENVTDVVPALDGADYYGLYVDDEKIQIEVDFGDESVISSELSKYQSALLTAGYTEAGADKYGDMHYASPNNQLDLCAWKGSVLVILKN